MIASILSICPLYLLTQRVRHHKREVASQHSKRAADKRTSKFLQAKILEQMTGEKSRISFSEVNVGNLGQTDMFELPPMPENAEKEEESVLHTEGYSVLYLVHV